MKVRALIEERLFNLHSLESAMPSLCPSSRHAAGASVVEGLVKDGNMTPELGAALWLYVDDLDRSHHISQSIDTSTGSYWHAIMHRREGDYSNAKYWFRRVGDHPVITQLDYDPYAFTDECQADRGRNEPKLVEMQRQEWNALFEWCLQESEIV